MLSAAKERSARQIVSSKTLVSKSEDAQKVQDLCQQIVKHSVERASDRTAGIIEYQCVRDNWDTNTFHFWERYLSVEHLNQHLSSPAVLSFLNDVQPHLESPIGMVYYEWKNGQLGNACVQHGPKGEGGLDDATGASGAAGGASYKQSSATVDLTQIPEHEEEESESVLSEVQKSMQKNLESLKGMFESAFKFGKK